MSKKTSVNIVKTLSLRIVKPVEVEWDEFGSLIRQIQHTIAPLYNQASLRLYLHLQSPEARVKNTNNNASIQAWLKNELYLPLSHALNNSYIASGTVSKLQSNLAGQKLKNLRQNSSRPPFFTKNAPVVFGNMKPGVKITVDKKDDFYIILSFPNYTKKTTIDIYKPWEIFNFEKGEKKPIKLLLSTKNRKTNDGWICDNGTEAEIKRVMEGKYKVSTLEIFRRKNGKWYINLSIKHEQEVKTPDKNKYGGIDLGIKNAIVCAVHEDYNRMTIKGHEAMYITKKQLTRLRLLRQQDRFSRGGHGITHKFEAPDIYNEKILMRRKKKIEEYVNLVVNFFLRANAGTVSMEKIDTEIKEKNIKFLKDWPLREVQNKLEQKLKDNGITIKYINPAFSSQICSKCGFHNAEFTWEKRSEDDFPLFVCPNPKCKFKASADYNAALNIANPEFEKIAEPIRKKHKKAL